MTEHENQLADLIDPGAELKLLGSGYWFTEGPVWNATEGCLYFSDIPSDVRYRWSEADGVTEVARPTFKGNGMAYDLDGNLLVCESVSSCVVRFHSGGERELVAFHYQGKYLNSPNDVVVRAADGSIYFTDPDYGRRNDAFGAQRSRELDFQGVYRVDAGGGPSELVVAEGEFEQPNGLCFSPDESLLYVNDSETAEIKVFDVAAGGSLSNGRVFFAGVGTGDIGSSPDGMECDELGNVWCTGPGGAWVIAPDGTHLGTVATPEVAGSLAWGGEDLRSLFLTTSKTLHVIRTKVASALIPHNH